MTSDAPSFGPLASLAIGVLLLVPFGIVKATDVEPFPAVIFPSGAGPATYIEDGNASFVAMRLLGFDSTDAPIQLSPGSFLDPIISSNVYALADQTFGQDMVDGTDVRIKGLKKTIRFPRQVPSDADRRAALDWLADRLEEAGARPDRLRVEWELVVVDHDTGREVSRELIDSEEIDVG